MIIISGLFTLTVVDDIDPVSNRPDTIGLRVPISVTARSSDDPDDHGWNFDVRIAEDMKHADCGGKLQAVGVKSVKRITFQCDKCGKRIVIASTCSYLEWARSRYACSFQRR